MKRDEAKQLLELCRPGSEADRQDPALAEAFAMLESDAELRAWFEEQQAADARISDSFNSIEVPADLKATILAGMRLHQSQATDDASESAIEFPADNAQPSPSRAWWQHPWIGIAALFAVVLVILNAPDVAPSSAEDTALAGLPPVIQYLSGQLDFPKSWEFEKRDENPDALKAYLASAHAPAPQALPDCLSKMQSIGCVTFQYENTKLSMICFKNGDVYHLITADKATYPDPLPAEPSLFECKGKAFRIWVDGEQVKILTVRGTKDDLPEII